MICLKEPRQICTLVTFGRQALIVMKELKQIYTLAISERQALEFWKEPRQIYTLVIFERKAFERKALKAGRSWSELVGAGMRSAAWN